MGYSKVKKTARKGVSSSKLLPLPASMVQAISLQNHLALEALRSQHGASLHATLLFRAIYLTYLLEDASERREAVDILHQAEVVLCRCTLRAENSNSWALKESEIHELKRVLTLHDQQIRTVSLYRYEAACAQLLDCLLKGGQPDVRNLKLTSLVTNAEFVN